LTMPKRRPLMLGRRSNKVSLLSIRHCQYDRNRIGASCPDSIS
jgi:hypothetical protein